MLNPIRSFLAWAEANQYDPALPSSKQKLWVHRHGWAKMYAPSLFAFAYYLFFSFMLAAYPEALREWTHVADLSGLVRREPELVAQLDLLWVHGEGWRVAFVQHAFGFALVMKWVALLWTPVFFVVNFFTGGKWLMIKRNEFVKGFLKRKNRFGIFYWILIIPLFSLLFYLLLSLLIKNVIGYSEYKEMLRMPIITYPFLLVFNCYFYQFLSSILSAPFCAQIFSRNQFNAQPKA